MSRFEFLKIENNEAYMLDTQRGVVVVAPVERQTSANVATPVERYVPDAPAPEGTIGGVERSVIKEAMDAPRQVPRAQSIIPPHMRGLFIPNDKPGADTETRRV